MRSAVLVMYLAACDGSGSQPRDAAIALDAMVDAFDPNVCGEPVPASCSATAAPTIGLTSTASCNPLMQTGCSAGEKCTWIRDSSTSGHIGCAPVGAVEVGCPCTRGMPGVTGYDDCVAGAYCHVSAGAPGICKRLCDNQGGTPACDAIHACSVYAGLFTTGDTQPAAAGVCDRSCNPLSDNDFLGSGSRPGCACGSATSGRSCYGSPSYGTPPVTAFTCVMDGVSTAVHRTPAPTSTNGVFVNACAPGYVPLLVEATGSSTIICVAFCKPANCYAGNCGANDENRLGVAPHRCSDVDRRGTFDTSAGGEHCQFMWRREVDGATSTFLASPFSDTLGFCYDHSKYMYDSDADNVPDTALPPCASLPDGFGTGNNFGAADLGCVDSTRMMATGKPQPRPRSTPLDDLRPLSDLRAYSRP